MSKIVDFYINSGLSADGLTLADMLAKSDEEIETSHIWVQWIFPLNETSNYNVDAPVVIAEDIVALRSNAGHNSYHRSVLRFMSFYGMVFSEGMLVPGKRFEQISAGWLKKDNHNLKRITRIIRCAVLLKLNSAAKKISAGFIALKENPFGVVNLEPETLKYWADAVTLPLEQKLNKGDIIYENKMWQKINSPDKAYGENQ